MKIKKNDTEYSSYKTDYSSEDQNLDKSLFLLYILNSISINNHFLPEKIIGALFFEKIIL